jgi:uncharacterized membrane protein YhaH (DUF805 family)
MSTQSASWDEILFGFRARVDRRTYIIVGFSLMVLKYLIDAGAVYLATQNKFYPWDYLNPVYSLRARVVGSDQLLLSMAMWTLPFCWIGVSMSVRRAMDAGRSPWLGTVFLFPVLNYFLMLFLCFLPSQASTPLSIAQTPSTPPEPAALGNDHNLKEIVTAMMASVFLGLALVATSIHWRNNYGGILFFTGPFFVGAINAYVLNRRQPRSLSATIGYGVGSVLLTGAAMLLFALEGVICLAMAAPIAVVIGILGSCTGYAIAKSLPPATHAGLALALLPLAAFVESKIVQPPLYEVVTTIEVNAPPEKVWQNVVSFSELPPPTEWYFQTGLAYPQRARIEGSGVGAIRRCEFSTGAFVEPITVWDEPQRLAFDVQSQPLAMHELSPYQYIHPPHLDGTIRSRKGEFRLQRLPNNRTLLEGHTWYELQMRPELYWTVWSDWILHRIHQRVLAHVKQLSEAAVQ